MDVAYGRSLFTDSSVIIDDGIHRVVMDDLYITSHSNIMEISRNVNVENAIQTLFIDTVLDEEADVIFPEFCWINCHQVIGGNMSLIRQLVVECNSSFNGGQLVSIRNNTDFESFEYWSAYRLILNNDTIQSVYPGEFLQITYSFVDRFGQITDHYPSNISISMINTELSVFTILVIREDGMCPLCEIGVYIEGISIGDVNNTYNITVGVSDNVLLSNEIEITVDLCPSGYGISEWGHCALCEEDTYSIGKTDGECIDCNEDELGDVIKVK